MNKQDPTETCDRVAKAKRFAIFGVPEIRLLDRASRNIEVLVNSPGAFERRGIYGRSDTARSVILAGLEFAVAPVIGAGSRCARLG